MDDNYLINQNTIKEPPTSLAGRLRLLGPGFILSASIVGSGELIATTTLGAKAGFVALWIIILSCLVKVAIQLEFGKHTIVSGETAMEAMAKLPGPRIGKTRWSVALIFFLMILKMVQLGGMIGSTSLVLDLLVPGVPVTLWSAIIALITSLLIYKEYYLLIEKVSLFMMAMFTIFTFLAVYALSFTAYDFSIAQVIRDQSLTLSASVIAVAIGAFGITGVASDEIIAYNYWCREKGYAACTGPQQDNDEWRRRAKGWIHVMYLDATLAMVVYTIVTALFYMLGAAVLHKLGVTPEGNGVIETLSLIYTESLGSEVRLIYLIGAFFVLFSSLVATNAAWTRIYADIFGQMGWLDFNNPIKRGRVVAVLAWIFPVIWGVTYLFIALPVTMILTGGFVGSFMLLLIVLAGLHFRYVRTQYFPPSRIYDAALWISIISIASVAIYGLVTLVA